ncbi:helix-turn-helix transcriptional regulator [Lysobacter sp. H21R4]|uniref:ArsR/SmtB family transcription factor n=1 Tax=Lysobacter sp. H21R4 TaxID=2781021 RepID=UPI00188774B4|nr:metalloregulator ArsR/SmtB family transcription factor [Lysobacter sp. H21R4]QOY62660.1 helix-turn-helix transcriptional regulator [Lysobacter sp. H21R4]
MKTEAAVACLAALAQKSRLAVFRHLVQLGPAGACPGDIAARLDMSASTLSFHLKSLAHARLIQAEQSGRSINYRADFQAMRGLVNYLTENCCGGDASMCAPTGTPVKARKSARVAAPARPRVLPGRSSKSPSPRRREPAA